ncbi:hypothetical protein FQZ97_1076940 [compost metagenome]
MACGCLVLGSRTAPVCEVVENGYSGISVDFFNAVELSNQILAALTQPKKNYEMRVNAKARAEYYSVQHGNSKYIELLFGNSVGINRAVMDNTVVAPIEEVAG